MMSRLSVYANTVGRREAGSLSKVDVERNFLDDDDEHWQEVSAETITGRLLLLISGK
jgi:hypothetical protein